MATEIPRNEDGQLIDKYEFVVDSLLENMGGDWTPIGVRTWIRLCSQQWDQESQQMEES